VVLTGKNAADGFHLVNGRAATRVTSARGCARAARRAGWRLLIIAERHILRARGTRRAAAVTRFRGGDDRWEGGAHTHTRRRGMVGPGAERADDDDDDDDDNNNNNNNLLCRFDLQFTCWFGPMV